MVDGEFRLFWLLPRSVSRDTVILFDDYLEKEKIIMLLKHSLSQLV